MGNRLSVSDVLNRFYHTHGDKYTYELPNFKTVLDKISIKCPKHGFFNQSIRKHYSGQGCPKCKGKNKTTEDVINEFKKVHKNKYIYDCVDFVNNKKPITIKCKTHGYFKQLYDSHIKGAGCPKCAGNLTLDTDQFIHKSKSIYGDKYSYEKTTYVNSKYKVIITCKTHGDFKQSPINHYRCEGCPKCAYEKSKKTNEEFIEKSKSIHGSKYDYSLVRYTHNSKKVVIVCRKHGKFTQTPNAHTSGYGCLKCGRDKSRTYISENPTGWRNTDWIKASLRSKNFDSFKVYIIRCWNDNEEFYK